MANKLKVDELRTELSQRGLTTTGTKPTLVRRLESALRKESEDSTAATATDAPARKKRGRDYQDGDSEGPEKVKATEKFREMGIKELREEATLRGIPASGSKKELVERVCEALEKGSKEDIIEFKEEKKEKLVTATKKGAAVLDQWLPDHIKAQYHILQHHGEIYDAMLNQTNLGNNNNKFYVIQVLESDDGGTYMVYNRWGRVGVKGQDKLYGPYTSEASAIQEFTEKFYAKTKNHWFYRKEFISYPKCYSWLEMDYSEKGKESAVVERPNCEIQPRQTQLEPRIAKFISLICNVSMMKQQMMEIGYNAEKLPLGKLSKSTILKEARVKHVMS